MFVSILDFCAIRPLKPAENLLRNEQRSNQHIFKMFTNYIRKYQISSRWALQPHINPLYLLANGFLVVQSVVLEKKMKIIKPKEHYELIRFLHQNIFNMLRQLPIGDQNYVVAEITVLIFWMIFQEYLRCSADSVQLLRSNCDVAFFFAFAGFYFDKRNFVSTFRDDVDFSSIDSVSVF